MRFVPPEEKNKSFSQYRVNIIPVFGFLSSVSKNVMVSSSKFGAVVLKWK